MKFSQLFLLALFTLLSFSSGKNIVFDFEDPKAVNTVSFFLDAPLEPFMGIASGIQGKINFDPENPYGLRGKIIVSASSLHLGNERMKQILHSEKWMDVEQYPNIEFEAKKVLNVRELKVDSGVLYNLSIEGLFTCRGVSKTLTVNVSLSYLPNKLEERSKGKKGDLLILRSEFVIKRSDYNISPSAATNKVANKISIGLAVTGVSPQQEENKEENKEKENEKKEKKEDILTSAPPEQLIVFSHSGSSEVSKAFTDETLPKITALAKKISLPFSLVVVDKNAPAEITMTPCIVYQNHMGRSIYQGRTNTPDRFENFIRTSRFVPQGKSKLNIEKTPVWQMGRMQVAAPLKITPLGGHPPEGHQHDKFVEAATKAILSGFKNFQWQEKFSLGRGDRSFYMDFYPWLSSDKKLYLSGAIYSQFHCKKPIFKTNATIVTNWEKGAEAFGQLASQFEKVIAQEIANPKSGDSFDYVSKETKTVSWSSLGFPLPNKPEKTQKIIANLSLPTHWVIAGPSAPGIPQIHFRFPEPLDYYAGEVKKVFGEVILPQEGIIKGSKGFFAADPKTVTMGEGDMNSTLQGSIFLHTSRYLESKFEIDSVEPIGELSYGQITWATIKGRFMMKGKTIPLTVDAEFEPSVDDQGGPLLLARGNFQISLTDFGIPGADGPEPQSNTLLFQVNLGLKPKK